MEEEALLGRERGGGVGGRGKQTLFWDFVSKKMGGEERRDSGSNKEGSVLTNGCVCDGRLLKIRV